MQTIARHRRPTRFGSLAAGLLVLGLAAAPALADPAEEKRVTLADQTDLAVTIYNENLALVKDRRSVTLDKGVNHLAFVDVSGAMRPETALLQSEGAALPVIEQNFDFDLLTPEKLLEKSVGDMVRVIKTNPQTGAETVEEGRILSVANGVVLQIGDRIETNPPGRIVFSEVPANLRARPTLVVQVDSDAAGSRPVELNYLTGGLSWRADYVAEFNAAEDHLDLNGWVTLTNTSGTSYRDAKLQLVAGEINQVRPALERQVMTMAKPAPAPAQSAMAEEALFEYHLYTLDRPTTLAENQTKQVALLSGSGIPVRKEYRFLNIADAFNYRAGEPERVNATVRLSFDNSEAARLGIPLPKGVVRVYKGDGGGRVLFVGEDAIEHTPKGETVRLALGRAFDVTGRARQTAFEQVGERIFETAFEVELKNAKPEPVTVTVVETIPGDWKMLQESQPHSQPVASQAQWDVPVPAQGSTKLTYRVRVRF